MKILLLLAAGISLFSGSAFGQGAQAIRRAKEVVNQSNVRQGVPSPAQNPAAVPVVGTNHIAAPASLRATLAGFKSGHPATAEQEQGLIRALALTARTAKPALPTVTKFAEALAGALSAANLTDDQRGRLATDVEAVLNSKPLPAAQFEAVISDVQAIFQVGGLKRDIAASVAADLKAVGMEVRR